MDQQEQNQEILKLEQQLREAVTASRFFEEDTGRLWSELVAKEITRITRDVTSDKYFKDHQGYVNAVTELLAYKNILKRMQVAGSPARIQKIKEKLEHDE